MTPSAQQGAPHPTLRQQLDSLDHAKAVFRRAARHHRRDGEKGLFSLTMYPEMTEPDVRHVADVRRVADAVRELVSASARAPKS